MLKIERMYGIFGDMRRLFALFVIFSLLLPTVSSANRLIEPAQKPLSQPSFKNAAEGTVTAIPVQEGVCAGDIRSDARKLAIHHSPPGAISGIFLSDSSGRNGPASFLDHSESTGSFGIPPEWGLTSIRLARADY